MDFIIVHNGLPETDYSKSCNGTWLMQRHVYNRVAYDDSFYKNSSLHRYIPAGAKSVYTFTVTEKKAEKTNEL